MAAEGSGSGSWNWAVEVGTVGEGEKSVYCPVGGRVREEYPGWRLGGREPTSEVSGGIFRTPRALGEGPGKSP